IPIGCYGMTGELAALAGANVSDETGATVGLALGATLAANALSLACAEVVLTELMRPADYDRMIGLGERLADGIEAAAHGRGLDWRAHRCGARTGSARHPRLPRTAGGAGARRAPLFPDPRRFYFPNRGIGNAIASPGPPRGFSHEPADIDAYLEVLSDFLDE